MPGIIAFRFGFPADSDACSGIKHRNADQHEASLTPLDAPSRSEVTTNTGRHDRRMSRTPRCAQVIMPLTNRRYIPSGVLLVFSKSWPNVDHRNRARRRRRAGCAAKQARLDLRDQLALWDRLALLARQASTTRNKFPRLPSNWPNWPNTFERSWSASRRFKHSWTT
jgi:hypothetical protein